MSLPTRTIVAMIAVLASVQIGPLVVGAGPGHREVIEMVTALGIATVASTSVGDGCQVAVVAALPVVISPWRGIKRGGGAVQWWDMDLPPPAST